VTLGKNGKAWWKWAWSTPQACAWGTAVGLESAVARRAALEDDLRTLDNIVDLIDLAGTETEVIAAVRRIAAMATGRLQILREMREMDDRLGLTPKGMAALRWKVTGDAAPAPAGNGNGSTITSPYGHLRPVAGD
jgi:hypothetical protein